MLPRAAAFAFAVLAASAHGAAADALPDPFKLYGGEMEFSVWRNGSNIGEHRVTFQRQGGALVVRSLFDIAVKFFGLTVYTFRYTCEEIWRGDQLDQLTSSIDDDGTKTAVNAARHDGVLDVTGPETHEDVTGFILPSSHWDSAMVRADRVLNTLDGKINAIHVATLGTESVPVGTGSREATHYRYSGGFAADTWYDKEGHWLKLRFNGKDGTPIDYVCELCMAPPP
jgi:hypothetical protein